MESYKMEKINNATARMPYVNAKAVNVRSFPHYHREIEAVRCDCGEIKVSAYNKNFVLHEGEIMFFMPYEIHSMISGEDSEGVIMKISAESNSISFARLVVSDEIIGKSHRAYNKMKRVIDGIKTESINREPGWEIAVTALAGELVLCIVRDTDYERITEAEERAKLKKIALLKDFDEYLEKNYMNNITLYEAARRCSISKFYFCRIFKEVTGMSFTDYISAYRAEKAAEMIKTTDFSCLEIALAVGFNNYQSFLRAFRRIYKTTPKRYLTQGS